jgi:hypothetical protein
MASNALFTEMLGAAMGEAMVVKPELPPTQDGETRKGCQREDCPKAAQGKTGLCIAHGGGRRCQMEGCPKGSQGSTAYCSAHGGGKRCQMQGCTKSARGSTAHCSVYGGGKRCQTEGCNTAAVGGGGGGGGGRIRGEGPHVSDRDGPWVSRAHVLPGLLGRRWRQRRKRRQHHHAVRGQHRRLGDHQPHD